MRINKYTGNLRLSAGEVTGASDAIWGHALSDTSSDLAVGQANMGDLIPELTIYQFIDKLKQHG